MVTVAMPQLRSDLLMPIERCLAVIEPGIHSHAEKDVHTESVGVRKDCLQRIQRGDRRPLRVESGGIVGFSYVARLRNTVASVVFLILEDLLHHHGVHSEAMHPLDLLLPVCLRSDVWRGG